VKLDKEEKMDNYKRKGDSFISVLKIKIMNFLFLCISIYFLLPFKLFPYGKEFSFRVKIEPPEKENVEKFHVVLGGTKINFNIEKNKWSDWFEVKNEDITSIKRGYPNNYLGRYPLVGYIGIGPGIPGTKIFLNFKVDDEDYSAEALLFGYGNNIGILQWENEGIIEMGTMAQYNRKKYWKYIDKVSKEIGAVKRPEKLIIVDRFIGDGDFYNWKEGLDNLSKLGFNALLMDPNKSLRELLLKTEIKKITYAVYCPPGYAFDFDENTTSESAIKKWAKDIAKKYIDAGFDVKDMVLFNLSDEPGWYFPSVFKYLENEENLERFHSYLKSQGLKPRDFGYKSWEEVKPVGRSVANSTLPLRKLYYWTCRFYPYVSHKFFARTTKALEEAFYEGLPITVNWNFFSGRYYFPGPFGNNPNRDSPDAAMGSHDWLEFGRERGSTCIWTEDWFGDNISYQWSFYCSKMKSSARKSNVIFGGYIIGRTAGDGVVQKILTIFGHGGKVIKFYVFGPEYMFPGNCWSENLKVVRGIMRASSMVAKAEELMYPGKPLVSKVAILTPQSSLVWDQKEMEKAAGIVDATNTNLNNATTTYMAEVYDIYLALMHSNIQTDFVDEYDLLDSKTMSDYKVLFITSPNLPEECIKGLIKWIEDGGIVVTTYGAITHDRYDEPTDKFYSYFNLKIDEPVHPRIIITWGKWKDSAIDNIKIGDEIIKVAWAKGKILSEPKNSEVIAKFSDGSSAIIFIPKGKGGIFHMAFYPGLSYYLSAIEANKNGFYGLAYGFSSLIRELIKEPVKKANLKPFVSVSEAMIEAIPLFSDKGVVVTVLNWSGNNKEKVKFDVHFSEKIKEVESVERGKIEFIQNKDYVSFEIPLNDADIILLKK
jgi:hypothetical protein